MDILEQLDLRGYDAFSRSVHKGLGFDLKTGVAGWSLFYLFTCFLLLLCVLHFFLGEIWKWKGSAG
jgi:hypothetical protein